MPDLTEVLLAQTEQRCAVKLGVAANVIMDAGLERLAVLAVPGLLGFVFRFKKDRRSVPILLLARQVIAALQYKYSLACGRQSIGERTASRTGADNDDVVSVGVHDYSPVTPCWRCCAARRGASPACSLNHQRLKMQRRCVM